jgi:hypothetical protein
MKGIVGLAVALGLAGTIMGGIALSEHEAGHVDETLQLTGGKETRVEFDASGKVKGHPLKGTAWSSNSEITGDRTGEYARTCIPLPTDEIDCSGSFLLSDGDIEVELIEEADPKDANSDGAIIGGTRAYEGALGSIQVDWQKDTYSLHIVLPED